MMQTSWGKASLAALAIFSLTIVPLTGGISCAQDAPAKDSAKPDAPKPDAPKADAPKADELKADPAKPDAPKPDAPKDAPKPETKEPAKEPVKEPAKDPVKEPAKEPAKEPGPKGKAFDAAYTEWKQVLTDLRTLRLQFDRAEGAEQDTIRKNYTEKLAAGTKQLAKLRAAALEAYQEAPNADAKLSDILISLAADDIRRDDPRAAGALLKVLLELKCENKQLHSLAGIAAYNSNDFAEAEKNLELAKKNKTQSDSGLAILARVAEVKENWAKELAIRATEAKLEGDKKLPRVELDTSKGKIVLELFEDQAPQTVGNFINLVEKGYYDNTIFHRVLPSFMAQGGDPQGTGIGGPGYNIYGEADKPDHRKHFAGSLSMAIAGGPNTGGSQFFMTFAPTPHLDGKHTVFGRVVEGWDVLPALQKRDPEKQDQPPADKILKAKVLNKRNHEYVPTKVKTP